MTPDVQEALKGSIRKWERIVAGTGVDEQSDNCPLCQLFRYDADNAPANCISGCPVWKDTERTGCSGTPYEDWVNHQTRFHLREPFYKVHPNCPECLRLAQAELDYLRSLLPPDSSAHVQHNYYKIVHEGNGRLWSQLVWNEPDYCKEYIPGQWTTAADRPHGLLAFSYDPGTLDMLPMNQLWLCDVVAPISPTFGRFEVTGEGTLRRNNQGLSFPTNTVEVWAIRLIERRR